MTDTTTSPLVYAGKRRRILANIIDMLILAIVWVPLWMFAVDGDLNSPAPMWYNIISVIPGFLYAVLMIAGPKKTMIGGLVLGIQFTGLSGERLTLQRSFLRHIVYMGICTGPFLLSESFLPDPESVTPETAGLLFIPFIVATLTLVIAYVPMFFHREKATLYDILSSTRVIRVAK